MSGGSWNYVYLRIADVVDDLMRQGDPLRRALGQRLRPYVEALHDIEWVDSGDYGGGRDVPAIKAALGSNWEARALDEVRREIEDLLERMEED